MRDRGDDAGLIALQATIANLTVDERLHLVDLLWDGIDAETAPSGLTDAQREELARRIADHEANPDDVIPWEEMKVELASRSRPGPTRFGEVWDEIAALDVDTRIVLAMAVWDGLADEIETRPIPDWHREELDRRLELLRDASKAGIPWEELRQQLVKRPSSDR